MGPDGAEIRLIFYDTLCSTWNILEEDSSMCEGLHYTHRVGWVRCEMRGWERVWGRIHSGNREVWTESGRLERGSTSTPIYFVFRLNQN